jgi:hypothetical protein
MSYFCRFQSNNLATAWNLWFVFRLMMITNKRMEPVMWNFIWKYIINKRYLRILNLVKHLNMVKFTNVMVVWNMMFAIDKFLCNMIINLCSWNLWTEIDNSKFSASWWPHSVDWKHLKGSRCLKLFPEHLVFLSFQCSYSIVKQINTQFLNACVWSNVLFHR